MQQRRGDEREHADASPRDRACAGAGQQNDSPIVMWIAPLIFHASNKNDCGNGSTGHVLAAPKHCAHGCRMPRSRRIGPMMVR